MEWYTWVFSGVGLLILTLIGIFGRHFWSCWMRWREFGLIQRKMPELFEEMRIDLQEHPNGREFFVLPKGAMIGMKDPSRMIFEYRCEKHENLADKVGILESYGFVHDITSANVGRFKMTEEFVDFLFK